MVDQVNWNQIFATDVSRTCVKGHVYSKQNLQKSLKCCNTCWFACGFMNLGSTEKKTHQDRPIHIPEQESATCNTLLL